MAAPKSLINYLDKGGIKYQVVSHKKVYTAYDLAQTLGEKLDKIAKTVLVKLELPKVDKKGKYYVLVLPASYKVNLKKLKKELKARKASIVSERELKKLKVKPGAVTPFGAYHKIGTLVDKTLLKTKDALVSAGSHTDALRIKVKDLHTKEGAVIGNFGEKTKLKLQKVVKKAKRTVKKAKRVVKAAKKAAKGKPKAKKKLKKVVKRVKKAVKKKVTPKKKKKSALKKKVTKKKAASKKRVVKKKKAASKKKKTAKTRKIASRPRVRRKTRKSPSRPRVKKRR